MLLKLEMIAGRYTVIASHGDEKVEFDVAAYDSGTLDTQYDIFLQINEYWAQMEKFRVEQIFQLFKQIRFAFDDDRLIERSALTVQLQEYIGLIYSYHDFKETRHWVLYKCKDIRIPDSLETNYQINYDQPGSREQTYLRDEYIDLVTYALLMRIMLPVWGEFIRRVKQNAGTSFKEYVAYSLLARTELYGSAPAVKLRQYIESNSPNETPAAAILSGFSSEEYPMWVLALVVTRRVCLGDLRGLDTGTPLFVRVLYNYIAQKVSGAENNFANSGKVITKTMEMPGGDDEDSNGSRYESYRIREEITIGDKVMLSQGLKNTIHNGGVLHIVPDLDLKQLGRALETASAALSNVDLNEGQVTLARWIFKSEISPRAFQYFSKPLVVEALAAAQTILWHWGYRELAMLVTAVPLHGDMLTRVTANADIKKYVPALQALFPYQKRIARGRNSTAEDQVVKTIETMSTHFNNCGWKITADDSLLAQYHESNPSRDARSRLMYSPSTLKVQLAQLIIEHVSKLSRSNPHTILPPTSW